MLSKKMDFSAALCGILSNTLPSHRSPTHHLYLSFHKKQRFVVILDDPRRRNHNLLMTREVLKKVRSNVSDGGNPSSESARVIQERVFAKTQKLEEIRSKDSRVSKEEEQGMTSLESNHLAALSALRTKEENLQEAERRVFLENARIIQTKRYLEQQEREIASMRAKQKELEEDLMKANTDLASQSRQIEDLKLLVEKQENGIASSFSALSLKEEETYRLRNELMKKDDDLAIMAVDLKNRGELLSKANEIIKEQEIKIEELQKEIIEEENNISKSLQLRKAEEEEKVQIVEANLEKQTVEWLSAREELKELQDQASKHKHDVKSTSKEFKRVSTLLAHVRSELISKQEALMLSHRKMEEQAFQFERQQVELEEQKALVLSFRRNLKDARLEVESEKTMLRVAETKCEDLEMQLSAERELIEHLQREVRREHSLFEQATQERAFLQKELQQKELDYSNAQDLLQLKESELVEARLQIQHLKSEQASSQLLLQEKDADLLNAQKELTDVNREIAELQRVSNSKSDQLIQATTRLKEKEDTVMAMQHELDDTKHKFSEATSVVQRITQLTSNLVTSATKEESRAQGLLDKVNIAGDLEQDVGFRRQKQLEAELETLKAFLREKEMELSAAQRALEAKDEELRTVLRKWDSKELTQSKGELLEDANGLKKHYSIPQEMACGGNTDKRPVDKLQLEADKLGAEAAISELQRIIETTCQLLKHTASPMDFTSSMLVKPTEASLEEAEKEVAHLFALTQLLVTEAGMEYP